MKKKSFQTFKDYKTTDKTPLLDDKNNMWKYPSKFQRAISHAAQIHHNGKFHWVASAKVDD